MSRGIHIFSVDLPDVPARIAEALESDGLAAFAAAADLGRVRVVISFGDGRTYEYPDVPINIAAAVKADPEGAFSTIKFWPGYRRIA
jgi:hypothetical protein